MLKEELPPELYWFELIEIFVDLGYLGMDKDYKKAQVHIPHKKPRKTKTNPEPKLTEEQKEQNIELSKIRIFVENAICGLKRYNILVHRFRNHRESFDDDVISIAAGLWNFSLNY